MLALAIWWCWFYGILLLLACLAVIQCSDYSDDDDNNNYYNNNLTYNAHNVEDMSNWKHDVIDISVIASNKMTVILICK